MLCALGPVARAGCRARGRKADAPGLRKFCTLIEDIRFISIK